MFPCDVDGIDNCSMPSCSRKSLQLPFLGSASSPSIFSVDVSEVEALSFPCDVIATDSIPIFSWSRKSLLFPLSSSSSSSPIILVDINMAAALLFSCGVDGIGISSMVSWASKSFLFSWINKARKKERNLVSNGSKLSVLKLLGYSYFG